MSQDCCSICLEALIQISDEQSRPIGAASCGHCLHCECFFRWKATKSNPYYEDDDDDECPCPVCNKPIEEFVRLYISGDMSENERLKKELKSVKRKLAHERARLQQAQHQLLYSATATSRTSAPSSTLRTSTGESSQRFESGGGNEGAFARSESTVDRRTQPRARQRSSRYRRHESCPLYFDTISDSDRGNRNDSPEDPSTSDDAGETRPDPPSPWSLENTEEGDEGDVDEGKLSDWVDRMALAVSQVVSDSFSSSHPEDPPCGGQ